MIINSDQLPVGFRFMPTDEELVTHYLMNKVFHRPVPAAQEIREIDAAGFYGGHPKNLVTFSCGEREWFFFIHQSESSHASQRRSIRVVGNGLGFWKPNGSEDPICDEDGNAFASKISLTYFSRTSSLSRAKRTHWKMVEYYLHEHDHVESNTEEKYQVLRRELVLCRMLRGTDYTGF
ncbi:NAC domain-containing protein 102-like [Pyrus ussuriensis x Pyrus communis]|uniref:NAC domain-containing protein 102-like n=1 Tax=Pyrus ussuriensis x Pyrus communis TaxID=2448454 RepID=A0A5N5I385_9ROSA|nr:NAC domain-containing protein 102-like [Pyrus ussuriensis x Pyrus communis]